MTRQTILVLGGGNALGAYHAGAYEQLQASGIEPDWVIGASAGAMMAALIAGNPPERRMERVRAFWASAQTATPLMAGTDKLRQYYNGWHVAWAALFGRPTIFRHRWPGFWAALPGTPNDIALYDHAPLRATLMRHVDFDRLNRSEIRFTLNCIDIETGEEVVFDNTRDEIKPEHILASSAITPGFPPIEIDGRMLCDPGYVNNTPIDLAFRTPPDVDTLCIVVELFCLKSPRPKSLDAILERTQDILFASQTAQSIAALRREYGLRSQLSENLPVIELLHAVYQTPAHELSMKTLDFSPSSIADRWAAGAADLKAALETLRGAKSRPGWNDIGERGPAVADAKTHPSNAESAETLVSAEGLEPSTP